MLGSGINSVYGVRARLRDYDRHATLPRFVNLAFQAGYKITRRGLLCWAPIPPVVLVPSARLRFLALEAVFCILFFAGPKSLDPACSSILLWKRESVDWRGLYSHVPFMELPEGLDMTDDELLEYAEKRPQRKNELSRLYVQRAKAKDLKGYLACRLRDKMRWTRLHPERVSEIGVGVRARARASERFRCETCDINLDSITALNKHLNTQAHKEQARLSRGGRAKVVSNETMRSRNFYAQNKANKTHYC